MSQRKRRVGSSKTGGLSTEDEAEDSTSQAAAASSTAIPSCSPTERSPSPIKKRPGSFQRYGPVALPSSLVIILCFLKAIRIVSTLTFLQCLTMIPVVLSAYSGLRRATATEERILPLALVISVTCAQLPVFVAALVACTLIVLFSFATLPRGSRLNNRTPSATSFSDAVFATVLLVVVLLTENFMVWVVSATFPPGQDPQTAPPPLQDNGRLVLQRLLADLTKGEVVGLRRMWNVQWALVACAGAAFAVVDIFYHPVRQLFSLAVRALLTLSAARLMRTVSFLLTVVPSQVANCYRQRFPYPPPTDTWEWIAVGLLPASHGGCNDLIISGHATVTTTLACVSASVSKDPTFQIALWTLLALDFAVEVFEGFHYSVDMWLGMVMVGLFWRVLQPLEGYSHEKSDENHDNDKTESRASKTTFDLVSMRDVVVYGSPALIAYLQAAMLPKSFANGVIVLYVVVAVVFLGFSRRQKEIALQQAYVHYSQHVLLCVMFITFATYL